MQCSCTTLFVFCLSIAGSLLYCIAGFFALEGTLDLLEDFGPEKGRFLKQFFRISLAFVKNMVSIERQDLVSNMFE